jgi:23S rRNA (cytidine1920-2'-O)/16S rRNA (cytidine1409-2'-O)-methyltransferase
MENGLYPVGLTYSPVTGAKGNIEYLMHLSKRAPEDFAGDEFPIDPELILKIVNASHEELE